MTELGSIQDLRDADIRYQAELDAEYDREQIVEDFISAAAAKHHAALKGNGLYMTTDQYGNPVEVRLVDTVGLYLAENECVMLALLRGETTTAKVLEMVAEDEGEADAELFLRLEQDDRGDRHE